MKAKLLALLLVFSFLITSQATAALDNKGKDFIMPFLENYSSPVLELHLTSDVNTSVTVHYPYNAPTFNTTVNVVPGAITIVTIPSSAGQGWNYNTTQNNAVHAFANDEFVAYMINRSPATSDAALALPTDVLNNNYIVFTYLPGQSWDRSEFVITAAYDNTLVTITPSNDMIGRTAAGGSFNVLLNKGESYSNRGNGYGVSYDLTGTFIESDKPIALNNGNLCANVPPNYVACDHIFEYAQPVQTWGKKMLAAPFPGSRGAIYRVLASEDNTNVQINGVNIATLNKGEFYESPITTAAQLFEADKPIFVLQFLVGTQGYPGLGDPAMGNIIPSEQYLNSYTFSTVGGGQFVENHVSIIAENGDVGSVILDGVAIPAGNFTAIGATGFSFANVVLAEGTHSTSSPNGHGIMVMGMNSADSYLYPGGAKFQAINPIGDANPPICDGSVSGSVFNGTATDNRPSEDVNNNGVLDPGEDLNSNGQIDEDSGIFSIELIPGSNNLTLNVPPFTPGDGVVNYTVTLTNPGLSGLGTVLVTDGSGNTCESRVSLNLGPTTIVTECESPNGQILGTIEFQNFGNCGCEIDALLFTPNPSGFISFENIDENGNWQAANDFTIVYDPNMGTLTLTIENTSGTFTKTESFNPGTVPNFLNIIYNDNDDGGDFWISDLVIDGGNVDLGGDCSEWTIYNICPDNGYVITGVINLTGAFLECTSSNIEIAFGAGNYSTDCRIPDDEPCENLVEDDCKDAIPSTGTVCDDCVKYEKDDFPSGTQSPVNDPEVDITATYVPDQHSFTFTIEGLNEDCEYVVIQTKSGNTPSGVEEFGPYGNGTHTVTNTVQQAISHATICVFNIDTDGIVAKHNVDKDGMKKEISKGEYYDANNTRDCAESGPAMTEVTLKDIAPNPASMSTDVTFTVGATQMVRVALFDAYGNKAGDIYNGVMKGGQEYTFSADLSGLAPGVYVINITGQGFVRQQKVVVMR